MKITLRILVIATLGLVPVSEGLAQSQTLASTMDVYVFPTEGQDSGQQSTDEATGTDAGHAPEQQLYLRTDWRFHRGWRLGAVLNAVAVVVSAVTQLRRAGVDVGVVRTAIFVIAVPVPVAVLVGRAAVGVSDGVERRSSLRTRYPV